MQLCKKLSVPLATLVLSLVVRAESGELESTLAMLPLPGSATVRLSAFIICSSLALAIDDLRGGACTINYNEFQ